MKITTVAATTKGQEQLHSFCVYYPNFVYRPTVSVCIVWTLCTGLQFLCVLSGLCVQAYSFCVYCPGFVYRPIVSVYTGLQFLLYCPDFVYRSIVSVCIVQTLCTGLSFLCLQAYSFCVYCLSLSFVTDIATAPLMWSRGFWVRVGEKCRALHSLGISLYEVASSFPSGTGSFPKRCSISKP